MTVLVLLPPGQGPLAGWLDGHGYASAAATLRAERPGHPHAVVWVTLPFGDEKVAAFLADAGFRSSASAVRYHYSGLRNRL